MNPSWNDSLLDLTFEYQATQNPETFFEILVLVNSYLVILINKFRDKFWWLEGVSDQEIYQISVEYTHNALMSVLPEDGRRQVIARIHQYTKSGLKKSFLKWHTRRRFLREVCDTKTHPYKGLVMEDFMENMYNLIMDGKLRYQDFLIMTAHAGYGVELKYLSHRMGVGYYRVWRAYRRGVGSVRKNLCREDYL